MARLTKRLIDVTKPTGLDRFIWDDAFPGFGLRVYPSGRKGYVLQYKRGGRTNRMALGQHGPMTPTQAREAAVTALAALQKGRNPADERRASRQTPKLTAFADLYIKEHAIRRKKPGSVAEDRRILDRYILPRLGRHKVNAIKRADVQALMADLADTPIQANRCCALLSKIMTFAERQHVRTVHSNPCAGVERNPERRRQLFLTAEQLARLGQALSDRRH